MLPIGIAPTARSLLAGVFGRVRGFAPPAPPAAPVATSIAVSPNGASIGLAQTQQLNATILDQFGQPFSGTVSWSTSNAAVATVNASGVVTPVAYGSVTITATFGALSTGVTLTVQQPTQVAITTQPVGNVTGSALSTQPVVRLRDAGNANVAESGRTVTVTIQSGSGTLNGTTSVATDSNGVATFTNLAIEATSPPSNFALAFSVAGLTGATSSSFQVSAASSGALANLPNDYTVVYDAENAVLPATSPSFNSEGTNVFSTANSSRLTLLNTGGVGDGSGYRLLFPQGMGGGAAPYKWFTRYWTRAVGTFNPGPNVVANTGYLYVYARVRVSSNWTDNGNAGTKFAFIRTDIYDGGGGAVSHYINLTNFGVPRWGINMEFVGGSGNRNFAGSSVANLGDGEWHDCEVLLIPNTPGTANGTVRTWVDGVLDTNATDVLIFNAAQTSPQWAYVVVDPTYGGGLNAVPYDLNMDVERMVVAVK